MSALEACQRLAEQLGELARPGSAAWGERFPLEGPWLRAAPEGAEQYEAILGAAGALGVPVYALGGGTHLGSLPAPATPGLLLECTAHRGIIAHDVEDLTVTVRAGTTVAELAGLAEQHGQLLALDAEDPQRATIGGLLASGFPTRHRGARYSAREQVLGMRVVHPDGQSSKCGGQVVKNTSGYDLGKLYCRSRGTLAVLLEISLRLHAAPPDCAVACAGFDRYEEAHAAALAVRDLDPLSLDIARTQAARSLLGEADAGGALVLIASWRGFADNLSQRHSEFRRACRGASAAPQRFEGERATGCMQRLGRPRRTLGVWPQGACLALHTRPSRATALNAAVERQREKLEMRSQTHLWTEGPGEVLRLLFPERPTAPLVERFIGGLLDELSEPPPVLDLELGDAALHNALRRALPAPPALELMRRAKRHFDPDGILFPGAIPELEPTGP